MAITTTIGKSHVVTGKLGLGTNKVGGHNLFPNLHDEDGLAVVKTALDHGIEMLDTAYMYGLGQSETLIGQAIQGYDRAKIILATKAAQDPHQDLKPNNDPKFLTQAIDDALLRLKTDKPDKAEAVKAVANARKAGKVRAIGVSNFSLDQIKEANQDDQVDVVEDHYSLVHRDAETTLFPYLKEHQISFVPYFPLASGLLTGKYGPDDADKFKKRFSADEFKEILAALREVDGIADAHQATIAQIMLAWYMKNSDIAVVIPGARLPEQAASNAKALDVDLRDAEYESINELFKNFKTK